MPQSPFVFREICGSPCFHKYKWCAPFLQCCMVFHSRRYTVLSPYELLGSPIFPGQPDFFRDNARDVSWQEKNPLGRWDNRKD